jgi:glycosyltransferase involved in cell wall biosynthesis
VFTNHRPIRKVAFLGNHTPRQCGLATFTADIAAAVAGQGIDTSVVAMNDRPEGYYYPACVRFTIDQNDAEAYRTAADWMNTEGFDVVCVQHEFGIYGGPAGEYLLLLLRELQMPIVTTLHTILSEPDSAQRRVMAEILQLSQRIIVMTERGRDILQDTYRACPKSIEVIPHGVPDVPFPVSRPDSHAAPQLMTFGLLSPDKGIEFAIRAMAEVVKEVPNAQYLVLGATHPHILRQSGEKYRESLVALAEELGVAQNIQFRNAFVSREELIDFIRTADVYITPYLKLQQITSGTLAYALACGTAIISTPIWHAEELLADGRGILVPPRAPHALAKEIISLLQNGQRRRRIQTAAYAHGRSMVWDVVGARYASTLAAAREDSETYLSSLALPTPKSFTPTMANPELDLRHLRAMTDDVGILQHASYEIPNRREGYCTDDNARALILAATITGQTTNLDDVAGRYLAFLVHAQDEWTGKFRNFMSYERTWLESEGSPDSQGRAIWALGETVASRLPEGNRRLAEQVLDRSVEVAASFTSPRAIAFALLGLTRYLKTKSDPELEHTVTRLANRLHRQFAEYRAAGWEWFEHSVTYDNARLPQALLRAGQVLRRPELVQDAVRTYSWLECIQTTVEGQFAPIGSNGFYVKGGRKAKFDQQPIEAAATIAAGLELIRQTGDSSHYGQIEAAMAWFHGENAIRTSLVEGRRGGCCDGIHPDRLNENMGAESTWAYLQSQADFKVSPVPKVRAGVHVL